jgi:phosphatidylglycerophosphate synthase
MTLIAWLGDSLDGPLARRSRRPTLLGRYDFFFDVTLTWSALIYVTLSGFLPVWLTVLYTLLASLIVALVQRKAVMILFMRPIDVTCGMVALMRAPEAGWALVATLLGLAVVHRQRLRDEVPRWLRELGRIFHQSP